MAVPYTVSDSETHLFKLWDDEDVINPYFNPEFNGSEPSLIFSGLGYYVVVSKHPSVTFLQKCEEFLVVRLVLCGAVVQVDTGGV